MKKINFGYKRLAISLRLRPGLVTATFKFIFLLTVPVLVVACHSPRVNDIIQPASVIVADTLIEPTGDAKLDSLLQLAAVAPQDTNLVLLYYHIAEIYKNNDVEKAEAYYLKLEKLSEDLDWNKGRYIYNAGISLILSRGRLSDSALVVNRIALEIAKIEQNDQWIANVNIAIGNSYRGKHWYQTALQYYMDAMIIYEKIKDTRNLVLAYYSMGHVYMQIDMSEKAIEVCEKAVALKPENPFALTSLARAYSDADDNEKAKMYYEEALRISEQQNNTYVKEYIYYQLSTIFLMDDDLILDLYWERSESAITETAQKYGGYLNLQNEEGGFAAEIMLPL
jgi:tetratricopeptide (TPR) repeat protein